MKKSYISNSIYETEAIASEFAKRLKVGDVVALYGKLGAGKTTFIQAIARALGVKKNIISPTFVIVRNYPLEKQQAVLQHVDLYRINKLDNLHSTDLKELIEDPTNITLIEWAEKAEKILSDRTIRIKISYNGKSRRKMAING